MIQKAAASALNNRGVGLSVDTDNDNLEYGEDTAEEQTMYEDQGRKGGAALNDDTEGDASLSDDLPG